MRILVLVAVWLVAATAACAQDKILIDGQTLSPGTYHLVLKVSADGSLELVRIPVKIFELLPTTPAPKPPKPTPPKDPPENPTGLAAKVSALAGQINDPTRAKTSRAIAAIYRATAELVGDGITTQGQLRMATNLLYGAALRATDKQAMWKGWKTAVDQLIDDADYSDVEAAKVAWLQIAAGMEGVK